MPNEPNSAPRRVCPACHWTGMIRHSLMGSHMWEPCSNCNGEGYLSPNAEAEDDGGQIDAA
jgi:DnaJ-class molecular chaperone